MSSADLVDFGAVALPASISECRTALIALHTEQPDTLVIQRSPQCQAMVSVHAMPRHAGVTQLAHNDAQHAIKEGAIRVDSYDGPFGPETLARRPNGATVRYLTRNGTRWMLRIVVHSSHTRPLLDALWVRSLINEAVVHRGDFAHPAGHPLPLRIPQGWNAQA